MSDTQNSSVRKGQKPTHRLYRVIGEADNAIWTPIGAARMHQDGNGFSIACDAIPIHGRIVMPVNSKWSVEVGST